MRAESRPGGWYHRAMVYLLGGIFITLPILFQVAPDGGWFGYAPLTTTRFSPGINIDFWVLGLQILGISSPAAGFNFITTIINMRAPGMNLFRMPMFTWNAFVVQFPRTPAGAALRAAQCRADLRAAIHHRRRHVSDTSHRVYSLRPAAAAVVLTADYCSPTTPSCVYCSQRHVAWADPSLPTK